MCTFMIKVKNKLWDVAVVDQEEPREVVKTMETAALEDVVN